MARVAEGVPCEGLSVSMPLPSVASLTAVLPHGLPLEASDGSAAQRGMPSIVQHYPTPCLQNGERTKAASKGCSVLAAGLPAKQALLLQPSGTTVSASSKDPAFAAPERPLSVLGANAAQQ